NRNQNESNQNIVPSSGTKSQARNKQREVINVVEELDLIIENYQKSSRDFYFENYKDERVIEEELSKKMREIYREAHEEEKKE
ncbi:26720_t:CDS:1, partial [Racocetra persica]